MSNELAIACVTRAIRNRLNPITALDLSELPEDMRPAQEVIVTALPLDRVTKLIEDGKNYINLFLYQTEPNAAFRNANAPPNPPSSDLAGAPLALNLKYIVTVYAEGANELIGHVLLGSALGILHEQPVFTRDELFNALGPSELSNQVERVKITPDAMSLEDVSKLWTGFQSEFRLSAAYNVSVVLIESRRPRRAPLPVLSRGSADRGAAVITLAAPSLTRVQEIYDPERLPVRPPHGKPAAELGDRLVLAGTALSRESVSVRFYHPLLTNPLERAPLPGSSATQVEVQIPSTAELANTPGTWPIGVYTVALSTARPSLPSWSTNRVPFPLAPSILTLSPVARDSVNVPFDLTLTCVPQIRERQVVSVLFGDRELKPSSVTTPGDPAQPSTVVVTIPSATVGAHVVRLRVDGVDSVPLDFAPEPPGSPTFDPDQQVTIT